MSKKTKDSLFWGIILLVIGALFLLQNFGFDFDFWDLAGKYWPLILIFIGLKNILTYSREKKQ